MAGSMGMFARFFLIARFTLLQALQRRIISIKRSWLFSPATQPDAWKVIARRPELYQSRVFKPRIEDAGPLPLVIMVHGGGLIFGNPSADDPLARLLADSCRCLVVSIDYRKAPGHPFPAGYEDVVKTISDLLGDGGKDLPRIDPSRVVLFGSSAGAYLLLAAAQDERLRGKALGIGALYPLVNVATSAEEQMAKRPDPSVPDFVGAGWDMIMEVYLPPNADGILRDPKLSPTFFRRRDDLPRHISMYGCEHDMLRFEAEIMAEKLADADASSRVQTKDGWQAGDVRWGLVKGQVHAFDHFPRKDPKEEATRVRDRDATYQNIIAWLNHILTEG